MRSYRFVLYRTNLSRDNTTNKMSNADSSIRARYETALKQNPIPTRIMLPNAHFVSNVLPGRTSSTTRRLKQLQKMYTANEFSHYTKGFKNRQLNLRTGLPSGRGVSKSKKKKKKQEEEEEDDQKEEKENKLLNFFFFFFF